MASIFQDVQEKVLQEVDAVVAASSGGDGLPPYAVIRGMEYLEMVVNETLRLNPIPQIQRVCTAGKVRFTSNHSICFWGPLVKDVNVRSPRRGTPLPPRTKDVSGWRTIRRCTSQWRESTGTRDTTMSRISSCQRGSPRRRWRKGIRE